MKPGVPAEYCNLIFRNPTTQGRVITNSYQSCSNIHLENMSKYGSTTLTCRDNFVLPNGNLKIELVAAKLKTFLRHDKCEAPTKKKDTTDDVYRKEFEEWEY